jgi:PAS domain S-box-containing protein
LTFRYIRPDGGQVWLEETARGEFDATGKLVRIKGLTRDITERKRAELALAERNTQLALAGKAGLVATFAYDVKTEWVQISEGYAAIYGFPEGTTEIARSQWRALVLPDDLEQLEGLRSQAFADRQREYGLEYRIVLPDRGLRWIETRSFISYDGEGRPQRVVGVNIDITERKRAEEARKILNAELDHRVKNTLATVSAVVSHTLNASSSMAEFATALDGRLHSMARTHELLSATRWQGVSVKELVRRELAPYTTNGNTEINGPEVILRAEAGQAMAMVLHELATNAVKYGSLSTQNGRVSIRWKQGPNGNPRSQLVLEWREIDGPSVGATGNSGFGTSTIRDVIPYELGGTVELSFAPEGVRCRLELPADWLSNDGGTVR